MNRPNAIPYRHSAVVQFRVVAGLWIAVGFACSVIYLHYAVLGGRYFQGAILASLPVVQSVGTSIYPWRKRFSTQPEATIRTAVNAVVIAGVCELVFQFSVMYLHSFRSPWDIHRIQVDYVVAVLTVGGFAAGSVLGMLRWRIQEQSPQTSKFLTTSNAAWGNPILSLSIWISMMTVAGFLMDWILFDLYSNTYGAEKVFFTFFGLVFIAPIPLFSPVRKEINRLKLTLRYWKRSALIIGTIWVVLFVVGFLIRWIILIGAAINGLPYFGLFLILSFLWAYLFAHSAQLPTAQALENGPAPVARVRSDGWILVALVAIGQFGALFSGVLALEPAALGFAGIGCLSTYSSNPVDYWFWKGYKGISSETNVNGNIMFRPAIDPSVCVTFSPEKMYDHDVIQAGYLFAANSWFSLIDPEHWESERSRQVRTELDRFIGRDFSSYDELQSWWKQNSTLLIWSGKDQALENSAAGSMGAGRPIPLAQS